MNIRLLYTTIAALSIAAMAFYQWDGETEKVDTELDNATATAGYWFEFNDSIDSGLSKIIWPVEKGSEWDENSYQPIVDFCHGICGHVVLSGAALDFDPYVGVGFNVVGYASLTDSTPVPGDASAWGGIKISYTCTFAPVLELDLGEDVNKTLGNDKPVYKLPKSTDGTTKEIPWEEFAQGGWGKGEKITGPEAATKLVAIRFKIQSRDSTEGSFHIYQIGPLPNKPLISDAPRALRSAPGVNTIVAGRRVSFTGITSSASVEIINLRGQIVKKGSVQGTSALDLSALDAGVYVVRASGNSVDFSGKIVLK